MTALPKALPLFPLRSVLFPGGLLSLRIFETRYLDMVTSCLREERAFGVVCLNQGHEVKRARDAAALRFEPIGTLAHVVDVDADTPGLLHIRCSGGARFECTATHMASDGLWWADAAQFLDDDALLLPGTEGQPAADALGRALTALDVRQPGLMPEERQLDSAGWVANRWCELLPIPLAARQQLMALQDPLQRLHLVCEYLREKQLI
ncbi:MAG: LON peptidase substrate-binding domain-containing protein [Vitreoscilla sp.]|nr:LON peptidase substrate-binding domain-containing protein [Vitreoscilla sp.]MBP6675594.1 LON peptidase substrate-binding domain-containing protein [Vitreoscilla sp.]